MTARLTKFLAAARRVGASGGGSLEQVSGDDAPPLSPADARDMVRAEADYIARMTGEAPDAEALDRAAIDAAEATRRVQADGAAASLDEAQLSSLEAVIQTNGSRPVAFVVDDFIDARQPSLAKSAYLASLSAREGAVRAVCAAVARVDDPSAQLGYQGTATVIGDDLVLTNRHVLRAISERGALKPGIFIDFHQEVGRPRTDKRFAVLGAPFVGAEGAAQFLQTNGLNFDGLDAAILKVDVSGGRKLPPAITAPDGGAARTVMQASRGREIYLVGYPGDTSRLKKPGLFQSIFQSVKSFKRLAPGAITEAAGSDPNDPRGWVIAHDASTLGGNSGSLLVDLDSDGDAALGLHFAGIEEVENWAYALEAIGSFGPFALKPWQAARP